MMPSMPSSAPTAGGGATLPGAMAGKPTTPGGSPSVAPGGGAGQAAAAAAAVKAIMPVLHKALAAFEVGSKEYMAVSAATQKLAGTFAKPSGSNLVPAAIQQIAGAAKSGAPVMNPVAAGATGAMANVQAPGQQAESDAV